MGGCIAIGSLVGLFRSHIDDTTKDGTIRNYWFMFVLNGVYGIYASSKESGSLRDFIADQIEKGCLRPRPELRMCVTEHEKG
jgi:hypothetical protein